MTVFINIIACLGTFLFMEFMAWFAHKYIMHGFLWILHKDHHIKGEESWFERNDMFFLIFAIPSALLFAFGALNGYDFRFWMGAGIALYGLCYFIVHDIFIHQRFKWLRKTDNAYFRAIRKAHKIHHKHLGKEHGECFGMLYVPRKYYKEAKQLISNK